MVYCFWSHLSFSLLIYIHECGDLWDLYVHFNQMMSSQVLSEEENNVKALFRRGKARAELGQTDTAREDFLKARKYAPEDKAITRELRLLADHDKALYQKQKEIYTGIFGPRPEPKPEQTNWLIVIWQWFLSLFYRQFRLQRQKSD